MHATRQINIEHTHEGVPGFVVHRSVQMKVLCKCEFVIISLCVAKPLEEQTGGSWDHCFRSGTELSTAVREVTKGTFGTRTIPSMISTHESMNKVGLGFEFPIIVCEGTLLVHPTGSLRVIFAHLRMK